LCSLEFDPYKTAISFAQDFFHASQHSYEISAFFHEDGTSTEPSSKVSINELI